MHTRAMEAAINAGSGGDNNKGGAGGSDGLGSRGRDWQKWISDKWWIAALAFLGGPPCLDLIKTQYQNPRNERASVVKLLEASLEKPQFAGIFVHTEVKAMATQLEEYWANFNPKNQNSFVMLGGPKGAGKTSAIMLAFGEKIMWCVLRASLDEDTKGLRKLFEEALAEKYGTTHPLSGDQLPFSKRHLRCRRRSTSAPS
eukprot:TRINITY_DN1919_c0_g1_i3.p1 TRINITY_DN1919_c0_g1~~TRINITY_DN1919_c0_g1_i3.p1  ORF type:complete len:200 (+),score=6.04 TRINITY_DN1919_c0_g1_i3:209-808(+)